MTNHIELYQQTGNKEYLRAHYERDAYQHIYSRIKPKWKAKFQVLVRIMRLRPGDRVLDVGCASKMFKPYVEQTGALYRGLDIAAGFEPDYVSDAETLEGVSDDAFDWVVMSDLLEHLASPVAALRSARRASHRVLAVVPNWYRLERFGALLPRNPNDRHLHKLPPSEWIQLFRTAGLTVSHVQGFFYVPSVAFYPARPLSLIDRLFRTAPFRLISKPVDHYLSHWPVVRVMGQELIIVGTLQTEQIGG